MKLSNQIQQLQQEQANVVEMMTVLATDPETGELKSLNEDQEALFNEYKATIEDLEARITRGQTQLALLAQAAQPIEGSRLRQMVDEGDEGETKRPKVEVGHKRRVKGAQFVQMAIAKYNAQREGLAPSAYARAAWDDNELAAMLDAEPAILTAAEVAPGGTKTPGYVQEITSYRYAAEQFIELLKPATIAGRLPFRRFDFGPDDYWYIPRHIGSVTSYWVGENKPIPVSALSVDQIDMNPRKLASLSVTSREAMRRTSPGVLELLRDDQVTETAKAQDTTLMGTDVRNTGDGSPGGLYRAGTSTVAASEAAGPGTGWLFLENQTADLEAVANHYSDAELSDYAVYLILHGRQYNRLLFTRDGNGNFAWQAEMAQGRVGGMQFIVSNNVNAARLHSMACRDILFGSEMMPMTEVTTEASILMSDDPENATTEPTVHLFQNDQAGIRTISTQDWQKRRSTSTHYVSGIDLTA